MRFLLDVWSELTRVPGWAWWMLGNGGAALWWTCSQIPELEIKRRRALSRAFWVVCVVVAFAAGGILVALFAIADSIESRWGGDDTNADGV